MITRKAFFCAALAAILGVALAACAGQPERGADEIFRAVYDRFRGQLILDGADSHVVVSGDTLHAISAARYGDGHFYPLIMLASSDVVLDPDRISPGMRLTVPDLQRNLDDPGARRALASFMREIADIEEERGRRSAAEGMRAKADSL